MLYRNVEIENAQKRITGYVIGGSIAVMVISGVGYVLAMIGGL